MGERGEGKGNKDNFYLFCGLKSAAAAATGKRRKMATAFLWEDDFLQFHFGFFFSLLSFHAFSPSPQTKQEDGWDPGLLRLYIYGVLYTEIHAVSLGV